VGRGTRPRHCRVFERSPSHFVGLTGFEPATPLRYFASDGVLEVKFVVRFLNAFKRLAQLERVRRRRARSETRMSFGTDTVACPEATLQHGLECLDRLITGKMGEEVDQGRASGTLRFDGDGDLEASERTRPGSAATGTRAASAGSDFACPLVEGSRWWLLKASARQRARRPCPSTPRRLKLDSV
jgi:hypothetical protein